MEAATTVPPATGTAVPEAAEPTTVLLTAGGLKDDDDIAKNANAAIAPLPTSTALPGSAAPAPVLLTADDVPDGGGAGEGASAAITPLAPDTVLPDSTEPALAADDEQDNDGNSKGAGALADTVTARLPLSPADDNRVDGERVADAEPKEGISVEDSALFEAPAAEVAPAPDLKKQNYIAKVVAEPAAMYQSYADRCKRAEEEVDAHEKKQAEMEEIVADFESGRQGSVDAYFAAKRGLEQAKMNVDSSKAFLQALKDEEPHFVHLKSGAEERESQMFDVIIGVKEVATQMDAARVSRKALVERAQLAADEAAKRHDAAMQVLRQEEAVLAELTADDFTAEEQQAALLDEAANRFRVQGNAASKIKLDVLDQQQHVISSESALVLLQRQLEAEQEKRDKFGASPSVASKFDANIQALQDEITKAQDMFKAAKDRADSLAAAYQKVQADADASHKALVEAMAASEYDAKKFARARASLARHAVNTPAPPERQDSPTGGTPEPAEAPVEDVKESTQDTTYTVVSDHVVVEPPAPSPSPKPHQVQAVKRRTSFSLKKMLHMA